MCVLCVVTASPAEQQWRPGFPENREQCKSQTQLWDLPGLGAGAGDHVQARLGGMSDQDWTPHVGWALLTWMWAFLQCLQSWLVSGSVALEGNLLASWGCSADLPWAAP